MFRIKSKSTQHTKNQKVLNSLRENQSTDANAQITRMLKLPDKGFKAVIIQMLQQIIINNPERSRKPEHFIKEIGNMTKDEKKLKNRITENILGSIADKMTEEPCSEL